MAKKEKILDEKAFTAGVNYARPIEIAVLCVLCGFA
jgi:hypothetical protein